MRHSHREDRLISQRLARHVVLTEKYKAEGYSNTEASEKAFKKIVEENKK